MNKEELDKWVEDSHYYEHDECVVLLRQQQAEIEKEKADAHLIAAAPQLFEALIEVVLLAREMFEHWDSDRDAKVGKYLLALSGQLAGYDKRTDEIFSAISKAIGES